MSDSISQQQEAQLPVVTTSVLEERGEVQQVDVQVESEFSDNLTVKEAENLREKILELRDRVNSVYFELGCYLETVVKAKVNGKPAYALWGYSTLDDYCERELGFRSRKARHLVSIYNKTIDGPIPREATKHIEWSKMALIAPLVDKGIIDQDNAEQWVEEIEGKNFEEVRAMAKLAVSASSQKASEESDEPVVPEEVFVLRVPLYKDQWENVQVALKKAEVIAGSDKKPHLLDCIALAFNSEGFTSNTDALDEVCRRAERVFGVRILAIDEDEGNKVVFGEQLARLLKAAEQRGDADVDE